MEQVEKETQRAPPAKGAALGSRQGRCPWIPPGALPLDPAKGAALGSCQGRCPWTPRRAFGPLDSQAGGLERADSLAGVTARNKRAATRCLRLAAAAAESTCLHPI